jgi:hypothetical protein
MVRIEIRKDFKYIYIYIYIWRKIINNSMNDGTF